MEDISYGYLETGIGTIRVEAERKGITAVTFLREDQESSLPQGSSSNCLVSGCIAQLAEYFAGSREEFDLELAPEGTDFQIEVWKQLLEIPYGETASYGDIAAMMNRPGAARAVGRANSRNPIAVIVPCHRIIGADGGLTGYAAGLQRKRFLLELEQDNRP